MRDLPVFLSDVLNVARSIPLGGPRRVQIMTIDPFGVPLLEIVDRALFPDFPAFLRSAAPPADA